MNEGRKVCILVCILSQSYNATVYISDNISFLAHVLSQLFLPNESVILPHNGFNNRFPTVQFYGGRVVEKI